jgi:hypothetical protein
VAVHRQPGKDDRVPLTPEQRAACERAGVEEVRAKMAYAGPGDGSIVPGLGDGMILRREAADWIREQREIVGLKPGLWGVSLDLRAAVRSIQKWWRT